jgi:hypothetical protein
VLARTPCESEKFNSKGYEAAEESTSTGYTFRNKKPTIVAPLAGILAS